MNEKPKFSEMQKPSDYYKMMLLRFVEHMIVADANGEHDKYIKLVKNLLRLAKPYIPNEYADKINRLYEEMKGRMAEIRSRPIGEQPKRKLLKELKYEYYDEIADYVFSALHSGAVIMRDVEGVVFKSDDESIKSMHINSLMEFAKAVRKDSGSDEVYVNQGEMINASE